MWVSLPIKICVLDSNSQISFPGRKKQIDRVRKHRADNLESNNLGDWKEWDDADTLQTKVTDQVTVGRLAYVTIVSVRNRSIKLGTTFSSIL